MDRPKLSLRPSIDFPKRRSLVGTGRQIWQVSEGRRISRFGSLKTSHVVTTVGSEWLTLLLLGRPGAARRTARDLAVTMHERLLFADTRLAKTWHKSPAWRDQLYSPMSSGHRLVMFSPRIQRGAPGSRASRACRGVASPIYVLQRGNRLASKSRPSGNVIRIQGPGSQNLDHRTILSFRIVMPNPPVSDMSPV